MCVFVADIDGPAHAARGQTQGHWRWLLYNCNAIFGFVTMIESLRDLRKHRVQTTFLLRYTDGRSREIQGL